MNEELRMHMGAPASEEVSRPSDLAARVRVIYVCDQGHSFAIPMASDAEHPVMWTCRCGADASRPGFERPPERTVRAGRTHFEILRERRSEGFLERLLAEELQAMRDGESTPRAS